MKPTLVLSMFLFASAIFGQESPRQQALIDLPKSVLTKPGVLGVFTDWKVNENRLAEVYLVNRTQESFSLRHAYGSVYLKLEAENEEGDWERAETHEDETCGTGLGIFELKPGHWIKQVHVIATAPPEPRSTETLKSQIRDIKELMARARMTKEAYEERLAAIETLKSQIQTIESERWEERRVRLRIYDRNSRAVSNVGTAYVSLNGIAASKNDVFSIRFASIERLREILIGGVLLDAPYAGYGVPVRPKHVALQALVDADHSIEDVTEILTRFIAVETDAKLLATAQKSLARITD